MLDVGDFKEESLIFLSVLRWLVLALLVGLIVGAATGWFLKALQWVMQFSKFPYYFWLLPVAMFLSAFLTMYLAPDAEGHGTEKVIEAVHSNAGRIKPMVVPVKLATTMITLATGGSVGKEGPCAQIGAGLTTIFSDILRLKDQDRKKLVICGISAGFAAVFGAPVSGAVFGIEVLFIGTIMYDVLLPSFIAGITAYQVAKFIGVTYMHDGVVLNPTFSESFFLKILLAGVFFGLVSFLTIKVLEYSEFLAEKIKVWKPLKGIIGGLVLVGFAYIFSTHLFGLGIDDIKFTLNGGKIIWYAFLLKMVFTAITLSFGGSGGIVTPLFYIGAASGVVFAQLMGLDTSTFAAIGLVSVVGGATNAPIAASIMALEMFGSQVGPYAAIACVISFLMTGHRSVYPSQVLAIAKSAYVNVKLGQKLEEIDNDYDFASKRQAAIIRRRLERLIRRKHEHEEHENKKPPLE